MGELTSFQLEILHELVDTTIIKSAQAMERMLKIRIRSGHVDFGKGKLRVIPELDQLGRFKVHVVKVKLKGEIGGAFYFIINGHEVDLINKVCLPKELLSLTSLSENKMMKHGFMSEIENMIASLSIGEISDFLGVQLLSEVPEVNIMPGHEVNTYLQQENFINGTSFFVKSVLNGVVVNISPFFIWMLDASFINKLRLNIVS